MAKTTCPNGHIYDPNIYGNQCPLCPTAPSPSFGGGGMETHIGAPAQNFGGMETQIGNPALNNPAPAAGVKKDGPTQVRPDDAAPDSSRTVIRRPMAGGKFPQPAAAARKLVGFLISYTRDPNGKAYPLYEGKNFVGRDPSCNISVPDDDQMSGKHLSILYRPVDNKFKFRDEQSSNGTFVNKELLDEGTLENNDIIRAGSTLFLFLAIPPIFG